MSKIVIQFYIKLAVSLCIVFGLHLLFLNYKGYPIFENKIILAYILNAFLAIGIFLGLYFLRIKHKDQLGYLFMFGSFIKFGVFFIFFYPGYLTDGNISRLEFFSFFTPYVICLIIETMSLIELLNFNEEKE